MKLQTSLPSIVFVLFAFTLGLQAQEEVKEKNPLEAALGGFEFRSIGPAFMSGRIADIAIDPTNENIWYVAVGLGGTWKTTNAGTTWTPLTDD